MILRADKIATALALCALLSCSQSDPRDGSGDGGDDATGMKLSVAELMDPETCKDCHPKHYREWRSSMHAYAAEDPVFLAMNQRGQRETDGQLGDFCVSCHAPMALLEGATSNGTNLDEVPDHLKGVTCYFCHQVVDVERDHNNGLVIARDQTMRAAIPDPVEPSAHYVEYSPHVSGGTYEGAETCGSCHDIITRTGVELERTFREWRGSVFRDNSTCIGCHMISTQTVAAEDPDVMVGSRDVHEHLWPAVDVALTPFENTEAQRLAIQCDLGNNTSIFELSSDPEGTFVVLVETSAGHNQPSGASQDRRMWLEFVAYDADDNVVFSSGAVADDEPVEKPDGDPDHDPHLTVLRDYIYDDRGEEVHMFWETAPSEQHPTGVKSEFLPVSEGMGPHTRRFEFPVGPAVQVERATVRMRIRPMGLDVLQSLVDSGDLDPQVMGRMPTFTIDGTVAQWTRAENGPPNWAPVTYPQIPEIVCPKDYRCELDPTGPSCD